MLSNLERICPTYLLTTSDQLRMPAKPGDVGYNLPASADVMLYPDAITKIPTNINVKIPDGNFGIITARSSSVFKNNLLIFTGIIDSGYTGELIIACMLMHHKIFKVEKGQSVAQLILFPATVFPIGLVDELPSTERGESRFGSSGH